MTYTGDNIQQIIEQAYTIQQKIDFDILYLILIAIASILGFIRLFCGYRLTFVKEKF